MKNKILQYIQQNKRKAWVSFLVKLEPAVIAHWKEYKYRIVERISKLCFKMLEKKMFCLIYKILFILSTVKP